MLELMFIIIVLFRSMGVRLLLMDNSWFNFCGLR